MEIKIITQSNRTGTIKVNYSDEINESIKQFLDSHTGIKIGYKQVFEMLFTEISVESLSQLTDEIFFKQLNYLKEHCLLRNGKLNYPGLNGFINYYKFLIERNIGSFNTLTVALLGYKDFLKKVLDGYIPVIYSPYQPYPVADKFLADISTATQLNKNISVLSIDCTSLKNKSLRELYKNFFWNYPEDYSSKKSKDVWLHQFLKIVDNHILENNIKDELPITISTSCINEFKGEISNMASTSQAVALSRIRQFTDFHLNTNLLVINNMSKMQLKSFNTKSEGDVRAYSESEIELIINNLKLENDFKSQLIMKVVSLITRTPMRTATICNLQIDCLTKYNGEGFTVHGNSKKILDDEYSIDLKSGNILNEVIENTNFLRRQNNQRNLKILNNIFIYPSEKDGSIKKLTALEVAKRINEVSKILGINELGTKGIRNYFNKTSNEFAIKNNYDGVVISSISKHSIAVHVKHYSSIKDFFNVCENYYKIQIGNTKVVGSIKKECDIPQSNLVQNGCGYCSDESCSNNLPVECYNCPKYTTVIDNIPEYENEINRLNKKIEYSLSDHEKEFYLFKKTQCVRYLSELLALKKGIIDINSINNNESGVKANG